MVCCDKCESWIHGGCTGLTEDQLDELDGPDVQYFCQRCEPRTKLSPGN